LQQTKARFYAMRDNDFVAYMTYVANLIGYMLKVVTKQRPKKPTYSQ